MILLKREKALTISHRLCRRIKSLRGFTLVETLIAVLLIGIALVAIATAFTNSSHILQKSRHTLTAIGILQEHCDYLRAIPFSHTYLRDLKDGDVATWSATTGDPIYIHWTVKEYDTDGDGTNDNDIRKVSINARWNERGKTITKRMVTLVTEGGINP